MNVRDSIQALIRPRQVAYAHCDIPCGIYDPTDAETAAETVEKMMTLMGGLAMPAAGAAAADWLAYQNSMTRYIATKEKHAEEVKHQVRIIWGDFFKAPDLKVVPDLHEKVWAIMQTASRCRVGAKLDDAKQLRAQTAEFRELFQKAKAARA